MSAVMLTLMSILSGVSMIWIVEACARAESIANATGAPQQDLNPIKTDDQHKADPEAPVLRCVLW